MNKEELENLIWARIDGELNPSDQSRLDDALAASTDAQELFHSAQATSAAIHQALRTKTPDVARARLLAALAEAPAPQTEPLPIWARKWPAAVAAAALILAWATGLFDTAPPADLAPAPEQVQATPQDQLGPRTHVAHSGLLQIVAGVSRDFNESLNTGGKAAATGLDRIRLKEILDQQDPDCHQVWSQKSECGCRTRLKQCRMKVGKRLGRPSNFPDLSRGLQLEAFRMATIKGVETPHLIMSRRDTEVSVYIFTKEHVKELFGCLCKST